MALADAIRALTEQWDEVTGRIGVEPRRRLDELTRDLVAHPGDPAAQQDTALEIVELLWPLLPANHPVRLAMAAAGPSRRSGAESDWALLTDRLLQLVAPLATPEGILAAAQRRLLAAPAFTAAEVRGHGENPDRPQLIRLEQEGGAVQLPAFQFDTSGRAIPLVLTINRLLRCSEDPWGVADWWLGGNAWLGGVPAKLLGRVDDDVLLAAARAVLVDG